MSAMPIASRIAQKGRITKPVAATSAVFLTSLLIAAIAVVTPVLAQGPPMTLKSAYDAGLIMISVEIAPQDKRGDRLQLIVQPSDKPVTITLPTETTTLLMAQPFDTLVFRATAVQQFALTPGNPAKLVVNQVGERRFVSGKFQIAMYEGKPEFVGSATVDVVK